MYIWINIWSFQEIKYWLSDWNQFIIWIVIGIIVRQEYAWLYAGLIA